LIDTSITLCDSEKFSILNGVAIEQKIEQDKQKSKKEKNLKGKY